MLLIHELAERWRKHPGDDQGVALVLVVFVALVGAIATATIAAAVFFVINGNASNKSNTQSYVAAESGRDVALSTIIAGIKAGDGTLACSSGIAVTPDTTVAHGYAATIRWATSTSAPRAWSSIASGADSYSACPTASSTAVVIHAVGTANGQTSTIDSAYAWSISPDTRPAGTLAYFDTQFTATKSTYQGDLVIRGSGNYSCNNGASNEIQGDLWVTNASVDVTGDCYVTGSIYAYGYVNASNKNLHVGGSIITQTGDVSLTTASSGTVIVGGQIYAGNNVSLTKTGTVGHLGTAAECGALTPAQPAGCPIGGTVKAVGTVPSPMPVGWKDANGATLVGQGGQPAPTISPTLQAVHDATAWLELDASKNLSQSSITYPNAATPDVCSGGTLASILATTGTRAYIDMSGCVSGNAVTVQPDTASVARDALIYVPPTTKMNLNLTNNLSNGNAALNSGAGPELLIIHGDANVADSQPTCRSDGSTPADSISVTGTDSVRTMMYSACGINNTIALTMTGQIYAGVNGVHLNGGTFTCAPMGWDPAFKNLACGVSGNGGIFDPNKTTQTIGTTVSAQSEQ
ncbi:hypothetical protein [Microbacterium sp. 22242]|uniref:hypothetical protein n=1 Tax=Microbacterium sp. 22242 TaxID=3453896 RepID=UPI003F86065E